MVLAELPPAGISHGCPRAVAAELLQSRGQLVDCGVGPFAAAD